MLNSERFADQPPREVYATLLDEGKYLCSWRTMYRILDENQEVRERRNQLRHPQYAKPELLATQSNQLWSWDITKLKGAGFYTIASCLSATRRNLAKIKGFSEQKVEKIKEAAMKCAVSDYE